MVVTTNTIDFMHVYTAVNNSGLMLLYLLLMMVRNQIPIKNINPVTIKQMMHGIHLPILNG